MKEESRCFSCKKPLDVPDGPIARNRTCDSCDADIRCCLNCVFYDQDSYNDCREPQSERVLDKDRSNFCDYFRLGGPNSAKDGQAPADALKKLDDLFK